MTDPTAPPQPSIPVEPSASFRDSSDVSDVSGATAVDAGVSEPAPRRKPRVAVILLSVFLGLAVLGLAAVITLLVLASNLIHQQRQQIEEQTELIDQKETFGAAMERLIDTARQFEGSRLGALVPVDDYARLAREGWTHRWMPSALDDDIADVNSARLELEELLATAQTEATTNATGSVYEATIDSLGAGFARSTIDDADGLCESDVLACVDGADPYLVHFDAADSTLPYMTDFIKTGIAYHEFAHVLQFTNPGPTETALAAFGGDYETMADCFALTYLPGWTLDHTVWVSSFEYWEVSIGYGYTCNADQQQSIRDWYESLPIVVEPISQG